MDATSAELESRPTGAALERDLPRIAKLSVQASVCLGRQRMTLNELCRLAPGTVIPLEIPCDTPRQLVVNDLELATGEVVRSGPLIPPVGEILTVSRALSMAGGLGRYASSTIQVVREGETLQIDINEVLNGKTTDPQLKPGDAIFVPQRRF